MEWTASTNTRYAKTWNKRKQTWTWGRTPTTSLQPSSGGTKFKNDGLEQARKAIAAAMEATVQGDLDWVAPSWGEVLGLVLQEAEELLEEEGLLDYVHPADVLALEEGADERPPQPSGGTEDHLDWLTRNLGAVAHFLGAGQEQLRQFLAAVLVWRQEHHGMPSIGVDTQTTAASEEPGPGDPTGDLSGTAQPKPGDPAGDSSGTAPWVPPLHLEQWPGSIPTTDDPESQPGEPSFPTDDELVQALEEYERQAAEEMVLAARGEDALSERGEQPEAEEHRRRRMLSANFDPQGNPEP